LAALYAFGSKAKDAKDFIQGRISNIPIESSDIDIGVRPMPPKTLTVKEKINLAIELEDLFGCRRVDLVVIPDADPFLAANIIRGERLYVRDEDDADEYELYILRRAGDLAPLERERIALILGSGR
jgi:predicted nucleotidyltransferase